MSSATARASDAAPIVAALVVALQFAGLSWWGLSALVLGATVLAAVHHAEVVAERVGEPFGTLILALAVTVIETGLIVSLMLAAPEGASALARDTVIAASMIILNLLLGLCLIAAGRRADQQRFIRTGANAALSTIAALLVLSLVLPNFTTSAPGPVYNNAQLAFVAGFALILYLTFVFAQTVRHRDYFVRPESGTDDGHGPSRNAARRSMALLVVCLFAVVLLAKGLSKPLETAIAAAGLPRSLVGIVIAGIVLLPEGLAAVKAARIGRLQTSLNLALGSALATIGLTIPAVAMVSFLLGLPLALGLDPKGIVLLALTLFVASLSLARGRVTVLHGAVHLAIFAAYILVTIVP
ncbi:calcium:proton antiporter [Sphingomonas astaxanthinifaciens]|uniref:Ionic antiporter n=1 Tax=Sphingomonas astaxanthinifaciens DSM 22298 TaxID=1123267 RepID=A0ABQ5Z6H6_9SPHN|nr:ionic transporter y4hA [Sphingomonas astaxanthinifaciens]GLR47127.1 ionic antiporter [Sphingomonas astaxanthinifaciens DSM 22298]